MVAVQYALQIVGMIFQTRSKSRVNSNKIADSGVVVMKYGKIRIEDGFLVFTRHMR